MGSGSAGSGSLDQRGLGAAGAGIEKVGVRSEHRPDGSLRIITARSDLTGQRELRWAADAGRPIGDLRCTQNLHFNDDARPSRQPNLLLCWRTSATRSVVTLMVDHGGHPSVADSAGVIAREWAALS
ncbi:hypothetical protein GCM10010172_19800 [Paractinoplanes ferrugineus]|uniref:Uncharacterized protein n=1 Tax=Paractinoplanes ferrugineus TaxID=113564 RepID=A0A919MLC4_9ACTN|nr:hypothetical protein [Actinoplanes ferrugineus]GIE12077.1 hypothetical protein Afe05nite_39170 [Actinoplanes ferrugineus]